MDGLKSPIYIRSRLSWVAERIQREKWPEADPQLAGVKVSKRRYSISHLCHNPLKSVRYDVQSSLSALNDIKPLSYQ